ncbi:MAG: hypothetical protein J6M60_07490 [Clostridia bacterium]|nr:hypothetical protein [Clostridia bacterium]
MEIKVITAEMIKEFKEKYKLSYYEVAGIFDVPHDNLLYKKSGDITQKIDNSNYVFELMNDEEKLKERVKKLYETNKAARKIYNKIFGKEENTLTMPCSREDLIQFRKKLGISQDNLAIIIGVSFQDIKSFEEGERTYFVTKNVDLNYYMSNLKEFYKIVEKAYEDGKITKRIYNTIINKIRAILQEKNEERENIKENKNIAKIEIKPKTKLEKTKKKIDIENTKKREYIRIEKKLGELRIKSKREEQKELDGISDKCTARNEFIVRLNDFLEYGKKINDEDIAIVKDAILYNKNALIPKGIRVCVFGTLRNKGYRDTILILNEMVRELDKSKYGKMLEEFRQNVDESFIKMKKEENEKENEEQK